MEASGGNQEASRGIWRHLEASWRPSETGGSFTIVKMQSNRRDRPFYRRVAKVGGTKYRKTHGFRARGGPRNLRHGFTNT